MAGGAGQAYRIGPTGVVLQVRVTPNAGVDRIEGSEQRDDGSTVLRLRVQAVPDRGKANAAVIALLAKALRIPKSSIELVSGDTTRLKTLAIAGDAKSLAAALDALG